MKKLLEILGIMAVVVGLGFGQQPTKLVDGGGNELQIAGGGRAYNSGMTLLTDSAVVVTAVTTKVQLIFCANIAVGAVTLTITDNQTSAKTYFNAVSIAANSSVLVHSSTVGLPFASGIKWNASATNSLNCQIVGVQ
jgi:hypothetical protein